MKCWKCDQNEIECGQMFCVSCKPAKQESAPEPKQRRKPQLGTLLYFCGECHMEVYRCQHVRASRKPQRIMEDIKKQARLALFQHMMRAGHEQTSLSGDLWINEESGDDGFEVPATGEKCPTHMQASRVLGIRL